MPTASAKLRCSSALVGFTQIADALPAKQLVELLNDIFTAFDGLADRFGLEKIKTIGDAYMAVSGLPMPRDDHAQAAVAMAIEMLATIRRIRDESGKPFRIRVGIHSDPVVAGVIGRNKFTYDLWGDTVNVASRMESHGLPDCVSVTDAVYEKVRDRYRFEQREVELKGKGTTRAYVLRESAIPGG